MFERLRNEASMARHFDSNYCFILTVGSYREVAVGSTQYSHIVAKRPIQVFQIVKTTGNKDTDNADPALMVRTVIDY